MIINHQFHYKNRKNLINLEKATADYILIIGNTLQQRSADTDHSFKQDNNFWYLTGINAPGACLLINVDTSKCTVIAPRPTKVQQIFDDLTNWDVVCSNNNFDKWMYEDEFMLFAKAKINNKKLSINLPPKIPAIESSASLNRRRWLRKLAKLNIQFTNVIPNMARLRMIKSEYEITNIEAAINLTKTSIDEANSYFINTKFNETDFANFVTSKFILSGSSNAYEPIVATGANAAVLHHLPTSHWVDASQPLLLDIGAEINNYAADISITKYLAKAGKWQSLICEITEVQHQLISKLKPGLMWPELQSIATELLQEVALKHKLINNKKDISHVFPHSIGHFLGLDVHDVGDYNLPLAPGMVITVEPGLYSRTKGVGVRIEDDILITKDGSRQLG